jgi:hypothetical protein
MEIATYDSQGAGLAVTLSADEVIIDLLSQVIGIMSTAPATDYTQELASTLYVRALMNLRKHNCGNAIADLRHAVALNASALESSKWVQVQELIDKASSSNT